jgi:hypothetical protein
MTIVSDYAGSWEFRGIVTPKLREWKPFNSPCHSNSSVVRLTFYGNRTLVNSMGYLKVVYDTGSPGHESNWKRFYFSEGSTILDLNIPEELLLAAEVIPRTFYVKKELLPRFRRFYGKIEDESWQVGLETLEQPTIPLSMLTAMQQNRLRSVGNSFILLPEE